MSSSRLSIHETRRRGRKPIRNCLGRSECRRMKLISTSTRFRATGRSSLIALDRTKHPVPGWHRNSQIAVGRMCIRYTAGSTHGKRPGCRSIRSSSRANQNGMGPKHQPGTHLHLLERWLIRVSLEHGLNQQIEFHLAGNNASSPSTCPRRSSGEQSLFLFNV